MRTLSPKGLSFITQEEGFVDHVYLDGEKDRHGNPIPGKDKGKASIGFGHLVRPGETFPEKITRQQGMALFNKDLARFVAAVNALGVDLTQNQFDALVSLAFNIGLGPGSFPSSVVVKHVCAGDMAAAAANFWQWRRSGADKSIDPRLVARRERERFLFLTPDEEAP